MEARFGFDLGRIRVHHASQTAVQFGAKALTRGDHIWFRPGRGPADLRLLGHEVAHVVQQATGETNAGGGQSWSACEALEGDARSHSEVWADLDRGPIRSLPTQAGPAVVQFDFEDDVLALLHRMPSADAESLHPQERRKRIAALSERREKLRQLFHDLPAKEAISVRERLRGRIADDPLSERFHDMLSTATRNELVDILDGAFVIDGRALARLMTGADFCTPFTKEELDAGLDVTVGTEMEHFVNDEIRMVFGDETADLWDEYLTRTPQDSLVPHVFSDPSSEIVQAFARHADTAKRQEQIIAAIERNLAGKCPRLMPGVWTDVDVTAVLPASELNAGFTFGSPATTIPGLIAGGVSGSAVGMDSRSIAGRVRLTRISGPSGASTIRLRTQLRFTVRDTVDFCPGGKGHALARIFTVPLSRLEASGLAFDVPFEVHYDGPPTEVDLGGLASMFCP